MAEFRDQELEEDGRCRTGIQAGLAICRTDLFARSDPREHAAPPVMDASISGGFHERRPTAPTPPRGKGELRHLLRCEELFQPIAIVLTTARRV